MVNADCIVVERSGNTTHLFVVPKGEEPFKVYIGWRELLALMARDEFRTAPYFRVQVRDECLTCGGWKLYDDACPNEECQINGNGEGDGRAASEEP